MSAQVTTLRMRSPSFSEGQGILDEGGPDAVDKPDHPMDSVAEQKSFDKLQEWWAQARESQSFVRLEMDIDDSFYHGDQFTSEDRAALEKVGQAPLVFNKIAPVCNWIIGTERRTRVDFNVLPRKRDHASQAQMKKDVMKYISDVSKAPFAKSESFKEAIISGLGWIEAGVRANETDDPIYIRSESWRNIWYDPLGVSKDTSDWRYLFRSKWTDLDIAQAMFPDRAEALKSCATSVGIDLTTKDDDEFYLGQRFSRRDRNGNQIGLPSYTDHVTAEVNNRRERVRLVECWYRMPVKGTKVKGGRHHGRILNMRNQKQMFEVNAEIASGDASTYEAVVMQVRCAVFCENVLLQNMDSPYHHNRFPFIPIFAYRKGKYHEPYGVTRNARDPQEDLNKRYSKALFLLSSTRIIADRNAVQDWEALREEAGRPDAQFLLDRKDARFEIHTEKELAEEQVRLMQNDGIHIMEGAGVTPENMGRDTGALSGKAVLAKQTQGSVVTAELFDNLRYSNQLLGEITLSLAEQFYDQEKAIRISGEKGEITWRDINTTDEDGNTINDITATQMDYIVTEQDFRDSMRQAMFESLSDVVSKMPPEMSIQMLDVVVDLTDFPGKQALVDRIRKLNGQMPPADQMTDEQKQEAEKSLAAKRAQDELKQQDIMLELRQKAAKCAKLEAEAKATLDSIGEGDGGSAVAQVRKELMAVQEGAATAAIQAQRKIAALQTRIADRSAEIRAQAEQARNDAEVRARNDRYAADTKGAVALEVARIKADATVEIAHDDLNRDIDKLETQLQASKAAAKKQPSARKPPKRRST